jgi:hypothetical protein
LISTRLRFKGGLRTLANRLGLAYLAEGSGEQAAAQFQKLLENRGIVAISPYWALAHLGLARADVLEARSSRTAEADAARVRALAAYKDFLTLWKDADSDIPNLEGGQGGIREAAIARTRCLVGCCERWAPFKFLEISATRVPSLDRRPPPRVASSFLETGSEKGSFQNPRCALAAMFSAGQIGSPVSSVPRAE